MYQNKNITSLIKYLFYKTKNIIKNNFFYFISLVAIHSILLLGMTLFNTWINENINIFNPTIGIIVFRVTLFLFISGLWIGYFKLIFNFIDNEESDFKQLFINFHVLPKIVVIQTLYYLTMLPFFIYLLLKFPYDINLYGTNFNEYLFAIFTDITQMQKIVAIQLSGIDILIFILFSFFPIFYLFRFWCAELLVIDKTYSIKNAMIYSYKITSNYTQLILLFLFVFILNISAIVFGYFIFIIAVTLSYVIVFSYYRLLLK